MPGSVTRNLKLEIQNPKSVLSRGAAKPHNLRSAIWNGLRKDRQREIISVATAVTHLEVVTTGGEG